MGVGEKKERKVILIVYGKFFSFNCKMPTWHVRIGKCKHQSFTPNRIEFNLKKKVTLLDQL